MSVTQQEAQQKQQQQQQTPLLLPENIAGFHSVRSEQAAGERAAS